MFWDFASDVKYATQTARMPGNHNNGNGRQAGWATAHEQLDRRQQQAKPANEFPTLPPMKAKGGSSGGGKQKSTSSRAAVAAVVVSDTNTRTEALATGPPVSSSSTSSFQEATMSADFESWCRQQML